MLKTLIVYGPRYRATSRTAEDIAEVLRQEGFDVNVIDAKKDRVKDISENELVVVGSGIQMRRWTKELEKFLKKHQKELKKKSVALFVCCGRAHQLTEEDGKSEDIEKTRRKYLDEKAAKYNLQPVVKGLF